MKNTIFLSFSIWVCTFNFCFSQTDCNTPNCLTNSIVVNTGYNHSIGSTFSNGQQDPYWILTNAPTGVVVNLNGPANVIKSIWGGPSTIDNTNTYISAFSSPGSNAANTSASINPYSFERCFCTCGNNIAVKYEFIARADNRVKFYIDGTLLTGQPNDLNNKSLGQNFDASDNDNKIQGTITLNAGRHCLRAELRNDHAGTPMGLDIKGTISTIGNSLLKETCCNNTGFIVGYKYHDKNCNGAKDAGEPILPNWQIQLTGNGVSSTSTTDANGYYTFAVPTGTYTINEVMQSGWSATKPAGGSQSGVVVQQNSITQIDFFNCNSPVSTICCPHLTNLIINPAFDKKTLPLGFSSGYTYDNSAPNTNSLIPGEQTIISTSDASKICSQWLMKSYCAGNFLLTNGANNQNSTPKLVWSQTVNNIKSGVDYKFCAKFFSLKNCCFPVSPKIDIKFSVPGHDIIGQLVEDPNKPTVCDFWRQIEKVFNVPNGTTSVTIQIFLHENGSGDGNDIGIDDIGFVELPKTPDERAYFNIEHQTNTGFTATVVDKNLKDCGVWWKVCEFDSLNINICKPNTIVENPSQWWTYPTPVQFWGYNGTNNLVGTAPGVFDKTKRYRIELAVWCPCSSWNGNAYIWDPKAKSFLRVSSTKN